MRGLEGYPTEWQLLLIWWSMRNEFKVRAPQTAAVAIPWDS